MKRKLLSIILLCLGILVMASACKNDVELKQYIPTYNEKRNLSNYSFESLKKTKLLATNFVNQIAKTKEEIIVSPISYIYSLGILSQISSYEGEQLYENLGFIDERELQCELSILNKGLNFVEEEYYSRLGSAISLNNNQPIYTQSKTLKILEGLDVALFANNEKEAIDSWYKEMTFDRSSIFPFDVKDRISLFSTYSYSCGFEADFWRCFVDFNGQKVLGFNGINKLLYKDTMNYTTVVIPTKREKLVLIEPKNNDFNFNLSKIDLPSYQMKTVKLWAPCFKKDSTFNLNDYSKSVLKLDYLFKQNSFTKVIKTKQPTPIEKMIQSTRFEMNRHGIRASSTSIFQTPTSADNIVDFDIDNPFIFILLDSANIPLFFGRINDI